MPALWKLNCQVLLLVRGVLLCLELHGLMRPVFFHHSGDAGGRLDILTEGESAGAKDTYVKAGPWVRWLAESGDRVGTREPLK